jgi:cytochrome P450
MSLEFDPDDPALHEDPYPVYRRLRDELPVHHDPDLGFWTLSRYDDVSRRSRHPSDDRMTSSHVERTCAEPVRGVLSLPIAVS